MTIAETIDVRDLPEYLHSPGRNSDQPVSIGGPELVTLEGQEKRLVVEALAQANGNQSEAARALRIGRDALRYKMKKHGLDIAPVAEESCNLILFKPFVTFRQ